MQINATLSRKGNLVMLRLAPAIALGLFLSATLGLGAVNVVKDETSRAATSINNTLRHLTPHN